MTYNEKDLLDLLQDAPETVANLGADAIPTLIKLLKIEDWETQNLVRSALVIIGDSALPLLEVSFTSNELTAEVYVSILRDMNSKRSVMKLANLALGKPMENFEIRKSTTKQTAIQAITEILKTKEHPYAVVTLRMIIQDRTSPLRGQALEALFDSGNLTYEELVTATFSDRSEQALVGSAIVSKMEKAGMISAEKATGFLLGVVAYLDPIPEDGSSPTLKFFPAKEDGRSILFRLLIGRSADERSCAAKVELTPFEQRQAALSYGMALIREALGEELAEKIKLEVASKYRHAVARAGIDRLVEELLKGDADIFLNFDENDEFVELWNALPRLVKVANEGNEPEKKRALYAIERIVPTLHYDQHEKFEDLLGKDKDVETRLAFIRGFGRALLDRKYLSDAVTRQFLFHLLFDPRPEIPAAVLEAIEKSHLRPVLNFKEELLDPATDERKQLRHAVQFLMMGIQTPGQTELLRKRMVEKNPTASELAEFETALEPLEQDAVRRMIEHTNISEAKGLSYENVVKLLRNYMELTLSSGNARRIENARRKCSEFYAAWNKGKRREKGIVALGDEFTLEPPKPPKRGVYREQTRRVTA